MKRLYRSEKDRMISGICGGIGEYYDTDPTIIRVLWVLVAVLTVFFPMFIAYLVLAIIIPSESEVKSGQKKRKA
ncbi:MAG TPA: PspC domain-containing protein [Candidatus Saccharimonadales bacterium]|nr:PspC domain-containing protein [Candidatus Saccharimonadales bacterium]